MSDSETSENSELSETQFENIETSESENDDFSDLIFSRKFSRDGIRTISI